MKKQLAFVLCTLLSVSLAACSPANSAGTQSPSEPSSSEPAAPHIEMQVQEYEGDTIAEIPKFAFDGENAELDKLNTQINDTVKAMYDKVKAEDDGVSWVEIKSYPFTGDRYLQVLCTAITYPNYATQGDVYSFAYDKQENRAVTLDDALALCKLSADEVKTKAMAAYVPPEDFGNGVLKDAQIGGFQIVGDSAVFYMKLFFDNPDASPYNIIVAYTPIDNLVAPYNGVTLTDPAAPDVFNPPLKYGMASDAL